MSSSDEDRAAIAEQFEAKPPWQRSLLMVIISACNESDDALLKTCRLAAPESWHEQIDVMISQCEVSA